MGWLYGDVLVFLLLIALNAIAPISCGQRKGIAVFGYLPEYRQTNFDYAGYFSKGLTHLIFFSLEVHPESYFPDALDRYDHKYNRSFALLHSLYITLHYHHCDVFIIFLHRIKDFPVMKICKMQEWLQIM